MKLKTIMIPASGLDSVPRYLLHLEKQRTKFDSFGTSDLAVYLSARALAKKIGPTASLGSSITTIVMLGGALSGGTLDTLLSAFDLPPARIKDVQTNMYSLTPSESRIINGRTTATHTAPLSSQGCTASIPCCQEDPVLVSLWELFVHGSNQRKGREPNMGTFRSSRQIDLPSLFS